MRKISVANGKYINKDGVEATNWVKVGVIGVSQSGKEYVLLDPTVNLAAFKREEGKDMVMCTVYDDAQQGQQQSYQAPQQQQNYQQPQQQQQSYQPPPTTYVDANGNPMQPTQNG